MKKAKSLYLIVCWLLFSVNSVLAGAPVWKVARGDHHLFLGGTVHVLAPSDYPLPTSFEQAYRQSTMLIFETDMQKMQSPEFQKRLLSETMYADGRSLKTVLKPPTYQRLEKHLASRGVPMAPVENFKPGMVLMTLTAIELQRLGLTATGVDQHFYQRAINDQKDLGELETPEEQLSFIATMGDGREDVFILYTLRDIAKLPELLQAIKEAWRDGDNTRLQNVSLVPFRKEFPVIYDNLIVKRNASWMPKIETLLETEVVEMVLVGAMHLVGDDGLLSQLRAKGCRVEMIED